MHDSKYIHMQHVLTSDTSRVATKCMSTRPTITVPGACSPALTCVAAC